MARACAKFWRKDNKTDIDQARRFAGLAALPDAERVASYLQIFCTGEGTPRKSIVTKAIKDAALVERLLPGAGAHLRAARPPPRRGLPRPQRGAAHHRL